MTAPTLTKRTSTVCLWQGDDQLRFAELQAEGAESSELAELQDEAEGRAVQITVEALPRKKYAAIVQEATDDKGAVDEMVLADALVPASMIEPKFASADECSGWLDELSDIEFEKLYMAALTVNRGDVTPKARLR